MIKWVPEEEPIPVIFKSNHFENDSVKLYKSKGTVEEYPIVKDILNCDSKKLLEEFYNIQPKLKYTPIRIYSGKNNGLFKTYNIKNDVMGSYTRSVLDNLDGWVNPRYTVAQPGWHIRAHIDYRNVIAYGFRLHIPLKTNKNCEHCFLINDEWVPYHFSEDNIWILNALIPHKAYNNSNEERIFLSFELWSDKNVPLEQQTQKINYLNDPRWYDDTKDFYKQDKC